MTPTELKTVDLETAVGRAIVKEAWAIEGLPVKALTNGYALLGRAAIKEYVEQQRVALSQEKPRSELTDEEVETIDLLPCPFCGSKADAGWFAVEYNISCANDFKNCEADVSCSAWARDGITEEQAMQLATKVWNTRTQQRAAPPQDDARREAIAAYPDEESSGSAFDLDAAKYLRTFGGIIIDALAAPAFDGAWNFNMDEAPKDGTRIIVMFNDVPSLPPHVELGKYASDDFCCNTYGYPFSGEPTHWMPLPKPPEPQSED